MLKVLPLQKLLEILEIGASREVCGESHVRADFPKKKGQQTIKQEI